MRNGLALLLCTSGLVSCALQSDTEKEYVHDISVPEYLIDSENKLVEYYKVNSGLPETNEANKLLELEIEAAKVEAGCDLYFKRTPDTSGILVCSFPEALTDANRDEPEVVSPEGTTEFRADIGEALVFKVTSEGLMVDFYYRNRMLRPD